jgi:SAM-dependent methyltransferase
MHLDRIGTKYLRGAGVELGARFRPFAKDALTRCKYVDSLEREQIIALRPDLDSKRVPETDLVDDFSRLRGVPFRSLDFIAVNGVFQELVNPLAALERWVDRVKTGGKILITVPARPAHSARKLTHFRLLFSVYVDEGAVLEAFRQAQVFEYCRTDARSSDETVEAHALRLLAARAAVPYCVWDEDSFDDFFTSASEIFDFQLIDFQRVGDELVAVLEVTSGLNQ